MEAARRPVASAMSALWGTLRGKFSNRQGHSKGAFPLTSKRGPRDFYKGKGAKSTGRLTKKGKLSRVGGDGAGAKTAASVLLEAHTAWLQYVGWLVHRASLRLGTVSPICTGP